MAALRAAQTEKNPCAADQGIQGVTYLRMLPFQKKKMMLSTIIKRVIVFLDTIKLSFKLDISSFLSTARVIYNGVELFEDVAKPASKVLTREVNLKKKE